MNKKILIFIPLIFIFTSCIVGVYALIEGITRKYPTDITITNIAFVYNDNTYLNDIKTDDLKIIKGEPIDIKLKLKALGNEKIYADYTVSLYAEEESSNQTSLSSALDLYYYNGYRYEYVAPLSELTSDNKYEISGECLSSTTESTIYLQLVYNENINDTYFSTSLANSVTLKTEANATLSMTSNYYSFVSSVTEFNEAIKETNKQIVLTSDLEIPSVDAITLTNMGIDLNGHKLVTNTSLLFKYTSEALDTLYIGDKTGTGTITKNSDNLTLTLQGKAINVHNKFAFLFTYDKTNEISLLKSSLLTIFETRIKEIPTKKEYSIDDAFPLFDGYYTYLDLITINSDVLDKDSDNFYKIKDYSSSSNSISPLIYLTINDKTLYSQILLSEVGINAALSKIKERFNGILVTTSIPLITYDNSTRCHIEYIINDGLDGIVLNSEGIYQANGIDSIVTLDSISVIRPTIIVKLSFEHSTLTYTIKDSESINLLPLNELEIKSLILNNEAKVLVCDPESSETSDTTLSFGKTDNAFLTSFLNKISNSNATVTSISNTAYKDNFEIDTDNKTVKAKDIENNKVIKTTLDYKTTFSILNLVTYNFDSSVNVTLLGKEEYKTRYDISNRLSSKFRENDYISGSGYEFSAYGSLAPTVNKTKTAIYIKYEILTEEAKDYVAIIYDYNLVSVQESQVSYFAKNSDSTYLFSTSELTSATLDSKAAYFIDITDLTGFTGDKYTIENGVATKSDSGKYSLAYTYEAKIKIKANLVPQDETTTISIKATLYNDVSYTDKYLENNNEVSYTFTLSVEGIIHYGENSGNISDYLLYSKLVLMFDKNNDGLITYSEAKASMSEIYNTLYSKGISSTYFKHDNTYNLDYLYLDSFGISSLDGIENFTNITGLSIKSSSIKSIDKLSYLHNLKYINLEDNYVTDIESLNLLDNLVYINLGNNLITDITPLKYLNNTKYLNLKKNKIVDLDGLTLMTNLSYLDLQGMSIGATEYTNDYTISYELALIMVNSNSPTIYTGSSAIYTITDEGKVAVNILKELERINRVYQKLYLPAIYIDENNNSYNVNWTCDNTNLVLTRNGSYYSFSCTNPVLNEDVNFLIQVGTVSYQRVMKVNVYKTNSDTYYDKYIYNGTNYTNLSTLENVDKALIDSLFNVYNIDKSTSTLVEVTSGTSVPEQFVISKSDFTNSSTVSSVDLSNKGITSLEGLSYFASYIGSNTSVSIDLTGNKLDSLEPLKELDKIKTLKLGSNHYDFNQLLTGTKENNDEATLINITNLYVSQCYDLSDEDVLKGLFRYYFVSSNAVNIYLADDSTKWDPYEELLPYKFSLIENTLTLKTLGGYDLSEIYYTTDDGIGIDFYGYTHYFTFDFASWGNTTIYTRNQTDSHPWGYKDKNYYYSSNDFFTFDIDNILKYKKYISGNETSYLVVKLTSTTNAKVTISENFTIEINTLNIANELTVVIDSTTSLTFDKMFGSKELKEAILSALVSSNFDFTSGNISLSDLQSITNNQGLTSLTLTGLASNTLDVYKGLHYITSITSLTVNTDFFVGTGEELVNIETLSVSDSYVNFSTLTSTLTSLKTLTLNKNLGLILPSGIGDLLTNLTTLTISEFSQNYMDLHQLTNLITKDSTSTIKTLTLNKVKNNSEAFTTSEINNIIIPLRNAYSKLYSNEPTYYVGNKTKNETSSDTPLNFVLKDDKSVNYVYVTSDIVANRWVTTVDASSSVINPSVSKDSSSDNSKVTDFGLVIGGTSPSLGSAWDSIGESALKQTKGTVLWMPSNTKYFMYSLYKDDTLVLCKDYAVKWYYFKKTSSNKTCGEITQGTLTDGYFSYTLEDDAYYIIYAVIPSLSNACFPYQFISGSGDGIYSEFKNNNLRFITYYFVDSEKRRSDWSGASLENGVINYTDFLSHCDITSLQGQSFSWISIYSNTLKISSLSDYETDDINTYLFGTTGTDGKFYGLTTINLPEAYYDISFTNTFGKLKGVTELTLTGSNMKFDSSSFTNYTSLTKLTLTGSVNFSPAALKSLLDVNTSCSTLLIKNTMCDENYDTLSYLASWSRTDKFRLNLNSQDLNTTSSEIKSHLDSITSTLVTDKTYNVRDSSNPLGYIYNNSVSDYYSISNTTYQIKWKFATYFIRQIGSKALTSKTSVPIGVLINDTSFKLIKNIPITLYAYDGNVEENANGEFITDNGTKRIDELNFDLIALAIKNNALGVNDSGYFYLTKTFKVDSDSDCALKNTNLSNFIVSPDGNYLCIRLTTNGNSIKIKKSIFNELYESYINNNLYRTNNNSHKDTTMDSKDFDLIDSYKYYINSDDFPTESVPYIYFSTNTKDNKIVLTINLPFNKIVINGKSYDVTFITYNNTYTNYGIEITSTQIVIDSANLLSASNQFATNSITNVSFSYQISDGTNNYESNSLFSISIYHGDDQSDNYIAENNLYVLANKDTNGVYLETNNGKVYFTKGIVYADISSSKYVLNENGAYALIDASYVFESGVFISKIIDESISREEGTGIDIKTISDSSRQIGKVLTNISSVTELYTNPDNYDTITSIKGIEYFKNLKILQLTGQIYGSLEGLESLSLERFFYNTNGNNPYVVIEDFTPLVEGSKDSLYTFQYGAKGNTIMNDLSFLLEFSKLQNLYFENSASNSKNLYNYTDKFAYLVYQLLEKGVNVRLQSDNITNSKYFNLGDHCWGNVYKPVIKDEYYLGFSLLRNYSDNLSLFANSPKFINDYSFRLTESDETQYIYLPATVESNGKLYLLTYTSDTYNKSNYIKNLGYYNVSSSSEEKITDYETFAQSNEYYLTYYAKTSMLYVKFEISANALNNSYEYTSYNHIDVAITCGCGEKIYTLSRRLTVYID